jgi:hypothetical protein
MSEETSEPIEAQEEVTEEQAEQVVPLSTLKKAEREQKKLARELEQLKAAEEERKQAEMSEVERLRAQAEQVAAEKAALERQVMIESRKTEALKAATSIGFADADVALRFVDLTSEDLESAEDIQAAVKATAEQYPYLLRQATEAAGPGRVGAAGAASTPSVSEPVTEEEAQANSFVRALLGN